MDRAENEVQEETVQDEPPDTLAGLEGLDRLDALRRVVPELPDRDLLALVSAVNHEVAERELDVSVLGAAESAEDSASSANGSGWNYRREPFAGGWLQYDPVSKKMADGSVKTYGYWRFHWIEGGNRKSEHIGNEAKKEEWKAAH
jgi:hypothetical protein